MSASYLHFVKQYQNRLGLTHKELNKLDRKHNDINLMKKLQQLYPRVSAASAPPPENTGFYGTLDITPEKQAGSQTKDIYARLYYDGNPLTNEITIAHPHTGQLEVLIADRLPDREAILTLRVRFEAGITGVDLDAYDGFEPQGLTNNPLTENNYLSMLVNVGNVDDGILSLTLVTSTEG
jgi:hypothetical protein